MSESNVPSKEKEVAEDYRSALADLHVNSKPLITMLTMLADENKSYAQVITQVLINHLKQTTFKLPAMYLVDSIVKNVGNDYKRLFGNAIANVFTTVFIEVDEKTRKKLYELRQTWNEVFPKSRLFLLDTNIHEVDPAWPITSQPRIIIQTSPTTIHVNPQFKPHMLNSSIAVGSRSSKSSENMTGGAGTESKSVVLPNTHDIEELQKLQTEKRVLQETRKKVEKMMQENPAKPELAKKIPPVQNIYIAPWKAKQILPGIAPTAASSPPPPPPSPKDPRLNAPASRESRVGPSYQEQVKDSRSGNFESLKSRDPRIAVSSSSKGGESLGSSPRDPRLLNRPSSIPTQTTASAVAAITVTTTTITTTTTTAATTSATSFSSSPSGNAAIVPLTARDTKIYQNRKSENKIQKERDQLKSQRDSFKKEREKRDKLKETEKKMKEKEKERKKHEAKMAHQRKLEELMNKRKEKEKKKELKEKHIVRSIPLKDISTTTELKLKEKKDELVPSPEDKLKETKADIKDPSEKAKRKEHIRLRVKSPAVEEKPVKTTTNAEPPKDAKKSNKSDEKSSKSDKEPESDESDHYEANKPAPSVYANKKDVISSATVSANEPLTNAGTTDTDLRQLAPQQENPRTVEGKTEKIIELFGKEDVDLRQLSVMTRVPPPSTSTAAAASAPAPAPAPSPSPAITTTTANHAHSTQELHSFAGKPDEDMRIQITASKVAAAPQDRESEDRRFSKDLIENKEINFRKDIILDEVNTKKPCFSSPHAAKWEKFREKNPEFKEYERQASISERMDADEPTVGLSTETQISVSTRFNKWERGRKSTYRHKDDSDSLEETSARLRVDKERDFAGTNFELMISQVKEQYDNGEISDSELRKCMEYIQVIVEQDKIRELQAKEREFGEPPPGWLEDKEKVEERKRDLHWPTDEGSESSHKEQILTEGEKWNEKVNSKIDSWHRGRSHRGPGPGPVRDSGPSSGCPENRYEEEWTYEPDLPTISEDVLRTVYRESETRTIEIDSEPREIRSYGERAMILMNWDDPRTLSFEPVQCRIVFDGGQFIIPMTIGEEYRDFTIDGEVHRVRLGVPTQELMIDGKGYQCFFGGKPITVHLAGKNRTISLDGKPPKVIIGQKRNTTFLLGKIELVVNAKRRISLYLDAKPQRFTIDGQAFVIKFVDAFSGVNINGVKFPVTFGDLPISISVKGCRRYLRFSNLPSFVVPGKTVVRGMDSEGDQLIPSYPPSPPPPAAADANRPHASSFTPAASVPPHSSGAPRGSLPNLQAAITSSSTTNTFSYSQPLPPPPPPIMIIPSGPLPPPPPPPLNVRGVVPGSYITSTGIPPPISLPLLPPVVPGGPNVPSFSHPPPLTTGSSAAAAAAAPLSTPAINVQDLLTRLVKTGIIGGHNKRETKKEHKSEMKKEESKEPAEGDEDEEELNFIKELPPVESMFTLDNLRKRRTKLIKLMHRGMQCSSCGLRYPAENTEQYSHHLDWHFRMNKKQQDSTKKVNTRKFYLCVDDWIQYEEIEDLDERVPSMFEVEGQTNINGSNHDDEDTEDIPSVAVSTDPGLGACPICHETFDQFFHQNTEDWHYKYALQVDGINYHPGCHQDHLKALKQEEERLKKEAEEKEKIEKEMKEESVVSEVEPDEPELEEIKVVDEDIQEIEKVKDEKPKVEIDLTEEDVKRVIVQEEEIEKEVITPSFDKVKEALENIKSSSNGIKPFRIKEEPLDAAGDMKVYLPPKEPPLIADLPIKMELEDEEENQPPSFDVEDDDRDADSPHTSWIAPATLNIAQTDIASSIDGNTELVNAPAPDDPISVPKIKISFSIPLKNNTENHLHAENNNNIGKELDEDNETKMEEFIPPPFTVDYNRKPGFRGATLHVQPLTQKGFEVSSLCAIM